MRAKKSARSGIRTHEAIARDLKSRPFDRSGIRAKYSLNRDRTYDLAINSRTL